MKLHIPQNAYPVNLLEPAADAGGRSSPFRSLKNAVKAWIVCHINQGNAATVALTPNQATTVAGAGAKAIGNVRIWTNLDQAAAEGYTAQTEAAAFTTDAAVKIKTVIFEIEPEKAFDVANDFDCIRITTGASNAANITEAMLYVQPKDAGAAPPTTYTD